MRLLYLDCFAGISGDMLLGALIDLGVSEDALRTELAKLKLPGYAISTRRVVKQNIAATKFDCDAGHEHHHRGLTEITAMIERSQLPETVKCRAVSVFRRIGEAEAKIHGVPLERVHFHEVGAVDSIVDIVGTCVAMELLGVDEVQAAPPPLGTGFVDTAHGRFPIPAPATLELLKGVPAQSSPICAELVTPTGAALVVEFATKFCPMPAMSISTIGYGAGSRELDRTPNVLRAVLGTCTSEDENVVAIIETNIDDMNPQWFGDVMERLLSTGALDVFLTAVQMKKNRPGTLMTVLCEPRDVDRFTELLLAHTTSFGVRVHEARRRVLDRQIAGVMTSYGEIQVKIGRLEGKILTRTPEYESCRKAANLNGVPVKEVYNAAQRNAEELT